MHVFVIDKVSKAYIMQSIEELYTDTLSVINKCVTQRYVELHHV